MITRILLSLAVAGTLSATARADSALVQKAVQGSPALKSIDVLSFGPAGLLLVGDGRGGQIVAIETGDTTAQTPITGSTPKFQAALAARLGAKADGIEIIDMAVNPASGRAYFAVRKQDDKQHVILTLTGSGQIEEFPLDQVRYVRIPLVAKDGASIGRITDVAWAEDRLIAAAAANEEFASKIFAIPVPLVHDAQGRLASAETYHVSHRRWETKAPMSVIVPFRENNRLYIVGAFACTPIVKYPVDSITEGGRVKGTSVIELGSGNRPLDMIAYEKDGHDYILANTFRSLCRGKQQIGPSPYWAVRFDRALLAEESKVNEQAVQRLNGSQPATDRIQVVDAMHGVVQLDRLNTLNAPVLRTDGEQLNLEVIPLP